MNTIGIIGAMEDEIRQLRDKLEAPEVKRKASMDFYRGTLHGKQVVVVRSGIG